MKALTLTQPWATLVAIGAKRIETRSWGTTYRGPLAIHAALGWTEEVVGLFVTELFREVLVEAGYYNFSQLPRGCIVATCELVSVKKIHDVQRYLGWEWEGPEGMDYHFAIDQQELHFGNFADGRSAWLLNNVQLLPEPIPARGALSLWEWTP
jgi:activating signal cointegrator 1